MHTRQPLWMQKSSTLDMIAETQVQLPDGQQTLCMLPAKFNKKLWVKRGGYLIIERDAAADSQQAGQTSGCDSVMTPAWRRGCHSEKCAAYALILCDVLTSRA